MAEHAGSLSGCASGRQGAAVGNAGAPPSASTTDRGTSVGNAALAHDQNKFAEGEGGILSG
jgi:hypothetical protein